MEATLSGLGVTQSLIYKGEDAAPAVDALANNLSLHGTELRIVTLKALGAIGPSL